MKKILILLMFSVSTTLSANAYFDKFTAEKIQDDVYVVHGPLGYPTVHNRGFMNNPAFIIAEKSVLVVDPGSTYETGEMLLQKIAKVTDKPVSHIFNTHIHGDHWLANDIILQKYPQAEIIADPRMIKKAKAGEAQTWVNNMINLTGGIAEGTKIAYPVKAVVDGDSLKLAGLTFKIHSVGIAHSNTDIMIEYVEGATLFTGDNVAYKRILRMDDGSFRDSIKAIDKAKGLAIKHYVPGHGPTGDVSIIEMQREYMDTLYSQVKRYYEEGLEDFEMKPKVHAALEKFHQWSGYEDELGKHISLAKLEIEKAEFE